MKKNGLLLIVFFCSFSIFSQEKNIDQTYKYRKFFTELRFYSNLPDKYQGFNIGYQRIAPMKLDGKAHSNIMHGLEASFQGSLFVGDIPQGFNPSDIMNVRLSYVAGYNHKLSKQLSIFGSIKPSISWTGIFTEKDTTPPGGSAVPTEENIDSNFDFVGLISGEIRYFFSEKGKHGIAADIFTSLEGGYGFTIGYTWRR